MRDRQWPLLVVALAIVMAFGVGSAFGSMHGAYEGHPVAQVEVNGARVEGDVPAIIMDGRTLVPLRLVSESLGAEVGWDAETYTVEVYHQTEPGRKSVRTFVPDPYVRDQGLIILSEPRYESEVKWAAEHLDELYLIDTHDNQMTEPDPNLEGYTYWEVECPETGKRGWLNKWWCLEYVEQEQPWLLEH